MQRQASSTVIKAPMKPARSKVGICALGLGGIGLILSMAGCMVGPDFAPPPLNAPNDWSMDPSTIGAGATTQPGPTTRPTDVDKISRWWETFDDPVLVSLVKEAVNSNLDLKIAEQRVLAARAQRKAVDSGLYPTVDGAFNYRHSRRSENTNQNFPGNPVEQNQWSNDWEAAWEIDMWGRVRRGIESADAQLRVEEENRNMVIVVMLGDVARNYMQMRGSQARAKVARDNISLLRDFESLACARHEAGLVSELDAMQARAQAAQAEAMLPIYEDDARQAALRIATLLGKQPQSTLHLLHTPPVLPDPTQILGLGIPADVLRRRPDVRASIQSLAVETAKVGVSAAELYPKITITGVFGFQGVSFVDLFKGSSRYYSILPDIRARVFDRERIRQEILVSDARMKEAAIYYELTIVKAIQEVEASIGAIRAETLRAEKLAEAIAAAQAAVDISRIQYERGIIDYLAVINAQQSLNVARDARVQSDESKLTQIVMLYKAMGGGWEGVPMQAEPVDTKSQYFKDLTKVK